MQWQHGRVWLEPSPGGRGTVFKFEWKKRNPMASDNGEAGMRSGKPVTILLVEDDEVDVKALRWAFDKLKIANPVAVARDGVEALELLKTLARPFLIITDINMPRMNGIEFLRNVRASKDLPRLDRVRAHDVERRAGQDRRVQLERCRVHAEVGHGHELHARDRARRELLEDRRVSGRRLIVRSGALARRMNLGDA